MAGAQVHLGATYRDLAPYEDYRSVLSEARLRPLLGGQGRVAEHRTHARSRPSTPKCLLRYRLRPSRAP